MLFRFLWARLLARIENKPLRGAGISRLRLEWGCMRGDGSGLNGSGKRVWGRGAYYAGGLRLLLRHPSSP